MAKGISIHIGLNKIDKNHYGTDGLLRGCVNDATSMASIASSLNYQSKALFNEEATALNVLREITKAAEMLGDGDTLLLTYAGHGAQVPDANGDEPDGLDETWCLYDRMLIDDELYRLWMQFQSGVRIIVVSDSCHSGSVARALADFGDSLQPMLKRYGPLLDIAGADEEIVPRVLPFDEALAAYIKNQTQYEEAQWSGINVERRLDQLNADVLLLAACQDNQTAGDGHNHGLFTAAMLGIWNGGGFRGNYQSFFNQIKGVMPQIQSPNYFLLGNGNAEFLQQQPFSVNGALDHRAKASPIPITNEVAKESIDERLARLKSNRDNPNQNSKGENTMTRTKTEPYTVDRANGEVDPGVGLRGFGPDGPPIGPKDDLDRRLAQLKTTRGLDLSVDSPGQVPRCVFNVAIPGTAIDGKQDPEVFDFFRGPVADQLMKNYMALTGINPPRVSGEISGGCTTKDGGSCEIHGTIRF